MSIIIMENFDLQSLDGMLVGNSLGRVGFKLVHVTP